MKRLLLTLFFTLSIFPQFSFAANQGDACPAGEVNRIYQSETKTQAALICDGAVLQYFESAKAAPIKKGIATNTPEATLDVNGEIKVGNTASACSATTEGAFRWNSTGKYHEFCDGTNWRQLVGAPAVTDETPDAFSFTDLTNQSLGTLVNSNILNITGFNGPIAATVSGGGSPQISVNGGAWTTSVAISPGDTLQVRMTTSGSVSTELIAAVTVGTITDNWNVTTRAGQLKIFLTSNTYNGNLGGLTGADAICQSEAGTLGYAGTYKAVLSDTTTNVKDRLTLVYPIVRASDGATVSSLNLWNGSLSTVISGSNVNWWSGSDTGGSSYSQFGSGGTAWWCYDWTSPNIGQNAHTGRSNRTDSTWIRDAFKTCDQAQRLVCISQ